MTQKTYAISATNDNVRKTKKNRIHIVQTIHNFPFNFYSIEFTGAFWKNYNWKRLFVTI